MSIQEQQRRFWELRELLSSLTLEYLWPLAFHLWSIYWQNWRVCRLQYLIVTNLPQWEPWDVSSLLHLLPVVWEEAINCSLYFNFQGPNQRSISPLYNHAKDTWEGDWSRENKTWPLLLQTEFAFSTKLGHHQRLWILRIGNHKETNMTSPEVLVMAWALTGCHNWAVENMPVMSNY